MKPDHKDAGRPETITCYHCGDACRDEHIIYDGKDFCCNGCKTVYEILQENDLCTYYDFDKNPGLTIKSKSFDNKYAYLDNEDIANILLDFKDGKRAIVRFYVPSIHCSSCIWLLENLYKIKEGIYASRVNFGKKEVSIDFDPDVISLRQIVELLATIGYEPLISLEDQEKKQVKTINRSLIIKIGVAGFAFGNIMLLSFPEYFGFEGLQDAFLKRFINYLNMALSLPVILYCSSDYFKSAIGGLRQRYINIDVPISLGILALFSRSIYEIMILQGPGYLDSLAGLVFFLLVGKWFQSYTYDGLSFERDYKSYFPLAVNRIAAGAMNSVPVGQLQAGDEILVRNMEIIPADSELLSEEANIDYSFVTGESAPVRKGAKDHIYAGGRQVGENIRLRVLKNVSQSYLMQLWNNEVFHKERHSRFTNMVNHISKYFTLAVLALAIVAFLIWYHADLSKALTAFTAVLIVACPCALALATPFTLGTTMRIFGLKNFYIKSADIVEHLLKIDHIVFDKTGTLTESKQDEVSYEGEALNDTDLRMIKSLVVHSNHPLSRRLDLALQDSRTFDVDEFEEVVGEGLTGRIHGKEIRVGSKSFVTNDRFSIEATRDTSSRVFVSENGHLLGSFRMRNHYRKDLGAVVEGIHQKYRLSILTGDNEIERSNLLNYFPDDTILKFRQSPQDKLDYIRLLQDQGAHVLMIGDGLNDAGALKQSDIGITITEDIANFSPSSDGILRSSELRYLPKFLDFSHTSRKIIIVAFVISFLYNAIGIGFAISGLLTPLIAAILMPLSSISVVAFCVVLTRGVAKLKGIY